MTTAKARRKASTQARPFKPAAAALLFALLIGGAAPADTVYLADGSEVEGKIVSYDLFKLVLKKDNGAEMTIPAERVARVEYSNEPEKKEEQPEKKEETEKKEEEKKEPAEGEKTEEKKEEKKEEEAKLSPEDEKRLDEAIKKMGARELDDMDATVKEVAAFGKPARKPVVNGLKGGDQSVAIGCSLVLRGWGEKAAVKPLIDRLAALNSGRGAIGGTELVLSNSINRTLESITGESMGYSAARSPKAGDDTKKVRTKREDAAQRWLDWWATAEENYPDQIGEPTKEAKKKKAEEEAKKKAEEAKKSGKPEEEEAPPVEKKKGEKPYFIETEPE